MKSLVRISLFTLLFTAAMAFAQAPQTPAAPAPVIVQPKQPYDSTHAQLAYEKEKNLQYQFAQVQEAVKQKTADLQQEYAKQEQVLKAWEASVRAANKWDDSYVYNRDTDQWTKVEKPKPVETKKPEAKK